VAQPTSTHIARYHAGNADTAADGRLFSHVFDRNAPPIIAALTPWLASRSGPVLEVGSGTGQHAGACQLAFPGLTWQPSDPDPQHRASVAAWAAHLRLPDRAALALDASQDWAGDAQVQALGPLTAVVSMNVIHIAPYAVARGIVAGAGQTLAPGGLLIFYGPFKVAGRHVGPGNAAFDTTLRTDNPDWGLRDTADIQALAETAGLGFAALQAMPANNRLLIFRKPH
jgi:SAM-dependent methyltransferase